MVRTIGGSDKRAVGFHKSTVFLLSLIKSEQRVDRTKFRASPITTDKARETCYILQRMVFRTDTFCKSAETEERRFIIADVIDKHSYQE